MLRMVHKQRGELLNPPAVCTSMSVSELTENFRDGYRLGERDIGTSVRPPHGRRRFMKKRYDDWMRGLPTSVTLTLWQLGWSQKWTGLLNWPFCFVGARRPRIGEAAEMRSVAQNHRYDLDEVHR